MKKISAQGVTAVLITILAFINLIPNISSEIDKFSPNLSAALGILIVAIFLSNSIRNEKSTEDNISLVNERIDNIEDSIDSINTLADLIYHQRSPDSFHSADILSHDQFYKKLEVLVKQAKKTVKVTSITTIHEPSQSPHNGHKGAVNNSTRAHYFDTLQDKIRSDSSSGHSIVFQRLVAISTLEKLHWVRHVLNEMKDCTNFTMRYLDFDNLRVNKAVPSVLALQIIDGTDALIDDLSIGDIKAESRNIWVSGSIMVQALTTYYDHLWESAVPVDNVFLDRLEKRLSGNEVRLISGHNSISKDRVEVA
jgi:hypothetical protein